jgi:hypothetical protein
MGTVVLFSIAVGGIGNLFKGFIQIREKKE